MTLQGFEVVAAKPKGERASEDEPVQQPIRPGEKSPADRRNLTNDERTVKRRRRRVHAAFSGPGYYLVDKDGAPQSERFDTMSDAEAQLQPESGELMQYLDQAPNSSHIAEPFPPNLNQVNGSLSMSARTDDEFAFEAAMTEGDSEGDDDFDREQDQDILERNEERRQPYEWDPRRREGARHEALSDDRISDAYERHIQWAKKNGHDPDTVKALRAHELARGITRAEANGIADLQGIGGGDIDWRSQGYRDEPWPSDPRQRTSSRHSEAELLTAMAKSSGNEQQALMGELEGLRREARRKAMADREIDLADAYIHASLTPVRVHEHHTAATDWIEEVAEPDLGAPAVHRAMVVEAQRWAKSVSAAVKEDREEYAEQARGVARLAASTMGPHRDLAFQTFMRTAMDGDQSAPESMVAPWGAPPMTLPPVGGGDAPFGMPTGGGPLNGQNFNPMATEVYPGAQVLPLDNGASVWPPADNLEGEAPLPPVAPDNFNPVASRHQAADKYVRPPAIDDPGGQEFEYAEPGDSRAIQKRFDDNRPVVKHPTDPNILIHDPGNWWDGPRHITKHSPAHYSFEGYGGEQHFDHLGRTTDEQGVLKSPELYDEQGELKPYDQWPEQHRSSPFEASLRRRASEAFNGPKQTYQEYLSRLSEGSAPMDQEHWAGSMAAVSPSTSNTTIPVTGMIRWAERNTTSDPSGSQLAGNPMAGYPAGGNWDKDEAHAQSGEAQSNLPLAPEGPEVADHLDWITDFPDTGPAEVPSDRAWNISANESSAGHDSGVTHGAARIPDAGGGSMTFNPDPGYADEYRLNDDLGTDQYMSEIPHDFEPSGNSQYCRVCGESRRHPMHVYARRIAADQGTFTPDRSKYPMAPEGDAQSTADYEQAYSSDRNIDYSETGIGPLGTVPVQGYGANPQGEMFNWQIGPPGPMGAADVADVPTPGAGTMGAPQPTDLSGPELPEGKEARLRAFRGRVRRSLGGQLRDKENQWSNPDYSLGEDEGSESND